MQIDNQLQILILSQISILVQTQMGTLIKLCSEFGKLQSLFPLFNLPSQKIMRFLDQYFLQKKKIFFKQFQMNTLT